MTKLYDGLIADLLQNPIKHDPEARAISYAILQEKRRIMDRVNQTRTMAMIDELPEKILDVLAVELRTPAYSESFTIEVKRTLIKGTLVFYSKLGTPEAVNWVVRSIFGNGGIEEWFTYGGEPHHFRVTVRNDGTFNTLEGMEDFVRLVSAVKRLSSWLDGITVVTDLGTTTVRIGGRMAVISRLPLPELADIFSFECTIHTGGQMATIQRHPLPELADTFSFEHTIHSGGQMAAIQRHPLPELADTFRFTGTLRTGGSMATANRIPIPSITNDITLSCTGRVGVTGAVTVTVPLPEIPS